MLSLANTLKHDSTLPFRDHEHVEWNFTFMLDDFSVFESMLVQLLCYGSKEFMTINIFELGYLFQKLDFILDVLLSICV